MSIPEYSVIKQIQDYYFSKVDIVRVGKKKYVLKSVPDFFSDQPKRQVYLSKRCRKTRIPTIRKMWSKDKRRYFLMDFADSDGCRIPQEVFIKTIDAFHRETTGVKSKIFPVYDFSVFLREFSESKSLMPKKLYEQTSKILSDLKNVFTSAQSVVHGDWVKAQLIGNRGKYVLIDFEMSFRGPSILDHAHFVMKDETANAEVVSRLKFDPLFFLKARIVETLRKFGWVINSMNSGHTTYKFKPELKEYKTSLQKLITSYRKVSNL